MDAHGSSGSGKMTKVTEKKVCRYGNNDPS